MKRMSICGAMALLLASAITASAQEMIPAGASCMPPVMVPTRCGPTTPGLAPPVRKVLGLFTYHPRWNVQPCMAAPRNPPIFALFLDDGQCGGCRKACGAMLAPR